MINLPYGQHLPRQIESVAVRVQISAGDITMPKWYTLDELQPGNPDLNVSGVVANALWNQLQRQRKSIQEHREAIVQIEQARLKRIVSVVIERNELRKRVNDLEATLQDILKATTNKKVHALVNQALGKVETKPVTETPETPCTALLAPVDIAYQKTMTASPIPVQGIVLGTETFEEALRRGASPEELKAIGDARIRERGQRMYELAKEKAEALL